jgi:hypothetical protein
MEYTSLILAPNLYPSINNYQFDNKNDIVLKGLYPKNSITLDIPSFEDLQIVEETTFRFILAVKEFESSEEYQYFVSPTFYEDLQNSLAEANPYFIRTGLDEGLFVKISLDKQIELFNKLKLIDLGTGVKQNQNLFLLADNTVDYVTLVQYIDWVVGKTNPLDNDNNGVIPGEKLGDFEIGKYNPETGEFESYKEQALKLQNRLEILYEELDEVDEAIAAISQDLGEEPKKRKTSVLEIISLGLGAVSVLQGVKAASGAIKGIKAAKALEGVTKKAETISTVRQIPSQQQLNETFQNQLKQKISSGAVEEHLKRMQGTFQTTGNVTAATLQTTGNVAKQAAKTGSKLLSTLKTAGKGVSKVAVTSGKFVAKQATSLSKIAAKSLNTDVGRAVSNVATNVAAGVATAGAAAKKQTDIVLKSVAKSAAVEVGKAVVKKIASKIGTAAVGKILGAATGPIGAGIMAAVGIVKFFVGKAKEKKEYKQQKAQYDRISAELDRLIKRKEDIEFEIQQILKGGKLSLDGKSINDKFNPTQKYFSNIGKGILDRQTAIPVGG